MIVGEHHFFACPSPTFPAKTTFSPSGLQKGKGGEGRSGKKGLLLRLWRRRPMKGKKVRCSIPMSGSDGGKRGRMSWEGGRAEKPDNINLGQGGKQALKGGGGAFQVLAQGSSRGASSTSTICYCSLNQSFSHLWQVDVLTLEFTFWPPPRWPPSLPWRRRWPP